ncbi:hypothetical protein [Roseofilum capinflatum]|uniref:Uncharacterized protein n=1 Tax=Roseofilum capinflatum BLCC-M114 TaxID=3022440 RepID=A0ABT7BAH2_9CYAN|nr:hypothetical protein [Roseofilum capinflatum]MDJ1176174.1 hypothetical protein [Roseofilum capinflatum BLCC-M114]
MKFYPRFLPYPRCFLRTLLTWFGITLLGSLLAIPVQLVGNAMVLMAMGIDGAETSTGIIFFGVLFLIALFFFLLLTLVWPAAFFGHLRQICTYLWLRLRQRPAEYPKRLPRGVWFQGFGDMFFSNISLLTSAVMFFLWKPQLLTDRIPPTEEDIGVFVLIWYVVQTYLYYFRNLWQEASDRQRAKQEEARQAQNRRREEQRQLREERRATRLQQQAEKRRQKQAKPQPQKPTPKASRPKKKPAVAPDFPEEFLEPEVQEGLDSVDSELERIRKKMNNQS